MAAKARWFGKEAPRHARALTASAHRIDLTNSKDAREERAIRQGWQSQAWEYRDSIGELRYALKFLASATSRMKLYPAIYMGDGETDNPIPLSDAMESDDPSMVGAPENLKELCDQAMRNLGHGKLAISQLLANLSENLSVAAECWLLGQEDPDSGEQKWSIRSIDEVMVKDDEWQLRQAPTAAAGAVPFEKLDPGSTVLSRIWTPHPRFQLLADGPIRACIDACDALLILRRIIRATGRSRLAGRGILAVPEELFIKAPQEYDDPEADPLFEALIESMTAPIVDEGVASSVVPMLIRGPADAIDKIKHLTFDSKFDEFAAKVREELLGQIATTLDLPKEVIMGVADLNHWTAWSVDDNTFRYHIEPHVITCCDALTAAYLRQFLRALNVPEQWVRRVVMWYDPAELVTHPDRAQDAKDAYDRLAISGEALNRALGFNEADMPSPEEVLLRLFQHSRTLPGNLLMSVVHQLMPDLTVPPITVSGTEPGVKPSGVDVGVIPGLPATGETTGVPVSAPPPTSAPADSSTTNPGPPAAAGVTAAGQLEPNLRASRQLLDIDRDLRARLQTAANAAMFRQLERAGAKLRTRVAKDETLRSRIAQRPNELVACLITEPVLTAAGFHARDLLGGDWSGLKAQFMDWVSAAQARALQIAQRLTGTPDSHASVLQARIAQKAGLDQAWQQLEAALDDLAVKRLYEPDPNREAKDVEQLNPDTLVPAGTIRAALSLAGGGDGQPGTVGQVGTGATIERLLTSTGAEKTGYEWVHATTTKDPFEPHLELDGLDFAHFDDERLANHGDWPPVAFYSPGDHDGCHCDAMPHWAVRTAPADLVRPGMFPRAA